MAPQALEITQNRLANDLYRFRKGNGDQRPPSRAGSALLGSLGRGLGARRGAKKVAQKRI
jgi:hypothetical protein